jgi:hypothetical protein
MINFNNNKTLVVVAAVVLTACVSLGSVDIEKVRKETPLVPSVTMTPEVPSSVEFCGKELDLTPYNTHEAFDRELSSFTYFHSTTMLMIKRANRYFPVIEPILKKYGIPDDFKYLAVIESSLDPRVTSPAKATGMWQFMEGTARQYGLRVNPTADERWSVEKSTEAACKYLKSAYNKYGDWATVAASYNAGQKRISDELSLQGVDSSLDLWLAEETSRYVYRIMAIKTIFESPSKYGFVMKADDLYKPLKYDEVDVQETISDLAAFAKQKGVTYADLKRFNPWLKDRKLEVASGSYTIKIPRLKEMRYDKPNTYVHNPAWVVK